MPKPQMRDLFVLVVLSAAAVSEAGTEVWPRSIIAITSHQRPINLVKRNDIRTPEGQLELVVLDLDSVQSIEGQLSKGLPNDKQLAQAMVEKRVAEIGRVQLDANLREAYLPLGTMMAYGLDRFPVIIFDRKVVIYGVTDLEQATKQYRQWIKDQQEGVANE
ncbi:MAG: TIGR03757 family integrating conjugative element protein [Pseudomonadales bacterium]|nr:TIGR03757 family integrating conjugative element protein [Pseudomonadales bacterium]